MIERIEINLLPAEYRIHRKSFKLHREIVYPLFGAVVVAFLLFLFTFSIENSITEYETEIKSIQKQINANKPIQDEINKLRKDKITIQGKIKALERINVNREKWVRLMEELSGRIPEFTWIVSIKEVNGNPPVLHLEGRTYVFSAVANYMSNLIESEYISFVDLSNIEQIKSGENNLYRFSISCKINPDANLSLSQ